MLELTQILLVASTSVFMKRNLVSCSRMVYVLNVNNLAESSKTQYMKRAQGGKYVVSLHQDADWVSCSIDEHPMQSN